MFQYLRVIKGIHPGFILEREVKLRNIPINTFASLLKEGTQTLVAISKGNQEMNTTLALKIEKLLHLEEGILMILQGYSDIEQENKRQAANIPDLSKLRSILFWDTTISTINWEKQKNSVIRRVFERGNESEKEEIGRFYGQNTVNGVMSSY